MLGRTLNRHVLELPCEELKSFSAWRSFLAGVSLLGVVGFFIWPCYGPQRVIRYGTMIENRNTVLVLNQEVAVQGSSEFRQASNNTLRNRIAQSYCQIKECKLINCSSIPMGSDPGKVASNFIETNFKVDCKTVTSVSLIFDSCKFPANKLQKNWLQTDLLIEDLTLDSCSLIEIEDTAFSLPIFEETRIMCMISNKILSLTKSMFRHLSKLEELSIRNNIIKQAEFNLLENVADTLLVLELNGVIDNPEVLRNITGGSSSLKIQILSIRGNRIPVIDHTIFSAVPEVRSLYVDESKVGSIFPEAFEPMANSISQLIMSNNNIFSLPEGLFDFVLNSDRQFRMTIENNPWHCDCKLRWMQELIQNYPTVVTSIPICKTPKINALQPFTRANFCFETDPVSSTSPTTKTATESNKDTTEHSTEPSETSERTISLTCNIAKTFLQTTNHERKLLSTVEFQFESRFPSFSALEITNRTIFVNLLDLKTPVTLLWFDSNNIVKSLICANNIKHSYLIRNVEPQTTYTICLLDDEQNTVSPLNCLAITTSPIYAAKTWLTNGDKTIVFSLLIVSFIVISIISIIFTFVLIRKHPSLLRGSKRVMLVKRRNVDAIVLPKGVRIDEEEQTRSKDVCSSTNKLNEDGYVTPLPPPPCAIRSNSRVSRVSLQSDGNSYVSGVEPSAMQLASWRLKRLKSELEKGKAEAPPLPPHPSDIIPSLSLAVDSKEDEQLEYSACTIENY